jgi:hypothetical protein
MYHFDLFLVLATILIIIFCFMEVSIVWGLISLGIGIGFLLAWIEYRTKLFTG